MISSKNFIQFASSTSVTIATNKFNSFPNRSSIFANKKSVLDVNHSSKEIKQLSAVGPLKAVAEEDKDLIGVEKSNGKLENKDISLGDVDIKGNSRYLNAAIVLSAGTFAISKLLTIDHDYWQGWTLYEVLRYAPEHNWVAYEEALKSNPVFSKMVISGIVYFLGDWIAQCYEGKPLFEFDSKRMFRSGFVGFLLHGSLSHYYYQLCDALFPFKDWWVVPVKVAFDQTIWAAIWNSIYYLLLGILRFEDPFSVYNELKATFWPMLTAGWKLWPFAHVITYGVIPVEQRLLWVDSVELIWVTILSGYSNEKSEVRISEASDETDDVTQLSSKSKKHSIEDVNSPD